MDIEFNVEIVKKGKWYIARIPELDFVTQGATTDEARKNIIELVEIHAELLTDSPPQPATRSLKLPQ